MTKTFQGDAEIMRPNGGNNGKRKRSTRYGTHIVHEGMCRVVIDVLMELSKRCLKDPSFWPKHLIQIATRLGTIRESIGGSLYLIRGFSKILASNDLRLRDLQKSIIELITDIDSPETLSAYLNIFSGNNPPVDLLLPRLVFLGNNAYHVQPSFELQFPSIHGNLVRVLLSSNKPNPLYFTDESITTTCDPLIFKDIKQIHEYQEVHKLTTAFTQSTYILPLNSLNFSPWNPDGFTVTTWIQLKSQKKSEEKTKPNSVSDDEDPFREIAPEKSSKKEGRIEKVKDPGIHNFRRYF